MSTIDFILVALLIFFVLYTTYYIGRYHGNKEVEKKHIDDFLKD